MQGWHIYITKTRFGRAILLGGFKWNNHRAYLQCSNFWRLLWVVSLSVIVRHNTSELSFHIYASTHIIGRLIVHFLSFLFWPAYQSYHAKATQSKHRSHANYLTGCLHCSAPCRRSKPRLIISSFLNSFVSFSPSFYVLVSVKKKPQLLKRSVTLCNAIAHVALAELRRTAWRNVACAMHSPVLPSNGYGECDEAVLA